jgi:hypothetical protein
MKSLLSENMLRFGTKNLSATQQKELIVKSIMETIDQHGLRNVIKNRLTEQAAGTTIQLDGVPNDLVKPADAENKVAIDQTPSSIGEAQQILGMMMKAVGTKDAEGTLMNAAIAKISSTNYPALTYLIRYKGVNGKRYKKLSHWLSLYMDKPHSGTTGPIVGAVDAILGVDTAKAFNNKMWEIGVNDQTSSNDELSASNLTDRDR